MGYLGTETGLAGKTIKSQSGNSSCFSITKHALRRSAVLCLTLGVVSGCVSQQQPLDLSAGLQQAPVSQGSTDQTLALATTSQDVPGVPRPAPRALSPSNTNASSSGTVLAVTDQTNTPVPAQTVIAGQTTPATPSPVASTQATQTPSTPIPSQEVASVSAGLAADSQQSVASPAPSAASTLTTEAAPLATNTATTASQTATAPQTPAVQPAAAPKQEPQATGLLARLFQRDESETRTQPTKKLRQQARSFGRDDGGNNLRTSKRKKSSSRSVQVASTQASVSQNTARVNTGNSNALPGVKSGNQLFGIKDQPSNSSSTASDIGQTQVAALGSLGRLSPNGLRVQHDKVQVACLKPGILRILKTVERRYGKKPIITSGYRSPKRNRRAGGARNSMHIYCKAVDIQVEGVSKWNLAKYLRTIPGRGGVGTYCRTKSVHIDTGKELDWHHPCRRSSKRKKRKT